MQASRYRLLLVSHNACNRNSGAQRVYFTLLDGLAALGWEVDLLHLEDFDLPQNKDLRLVIQRFALPSWVSRKLAKKNLDKYDFVMASSGMTAPLFSRRRSEKQRPLYVNHLHGLCVYDHAANLNESNLGQWPVSRAYRFVTGPYQVRWDNEGIIRSDLTIVQNYRDLSYIRTRFPNTSTTFIPPALYPELMERGARAAASQKKHSKSILWFGTWESRKGAYYIPAAFRLIRKRCPDASLTIGGTGRDKDWLLKQFDLDDRTNVTILDQISIEDHMLLMEQSAIFLFPSLSEGFGLAALEAARFAVAPVTTLTGFGADFLRDGKSARLVLPSSWHIAEAVIDLLENDELRIGIANAAQRVASEFTVSRMANAYHLALAQLRTDKDGNQLK